MIAPEYIHPAPLVLKEKGADDCKARILTSFETKRTRHEKKGSSTGGEVNSRSCWEANGWDVCMPCYKDGAKGENARYMVAVGKSRISSKSPNQKILAHL